MYGVVRERARGRSMRIAGLAISALATVAAANLLMNGFGNFVGAFTPESITLTTIAPEKETEPPPEFDKFDVDETRLDAPPVPIPDEIFVYKDDIPPITAIDGGGSDGGPGAAVAPAKLVRIAPKMRSQEKPPYPAIEQRGGYEGNTGLSLCIDARGRVASAKLVTSSGRPRLDEAALNWVKDARFTPGTVDGIAQAVCGHTVVYEWRLEDER